MRNFRPWIPALCAVSVMVWAAGCSGSPGAKSFADALEKSDLKLAFTSSADRDGFPATELSNGEIRVWIIETPNEKEFQKAFKAAKDWIDSRAILKRAGSDAPVIPDLDYALYSSHHLIIKVMPSDAAPRVEPILKSVSGTIELFVSTH